MYVSLPSLPFSKAFSMVLINAAYFFGALSPLRRRRGAGLGRFDALSRRLLAFARRTSLFSCAVRFVETI